MILDALERAGEIRMGYGRSSEFGAVDLVVDEIAEDKVNDVTKQDNMNRRNMYMMR